MTKPELAAVAIGVLFLLLVGSWVRGVVAERDEARGRALAAEQANLTLTLEAEASRKALADRERTIEALTAEAKALKGRLNEAYEADPEARAWADCALPDAVACLLR